MTHKTLKSPPVNSPESSTMSSAKKKTTKPDDPEKRFSIDHTIQCFILAYPKEKPSSQKSTNSSGQKGKLSALMECKLPESV